MDIFRVDLDLKATLLGMSEEDLTAFAELQQDAPSGVPVELLIFINFLLYHKTRRVENIEHARNLSEGWIAITAADDPAKTHREEILNMLSAVLMQATLQSEEHERGDPSGAENRLEYGVENLLDDRGFLDTVIPRLEEIVTNPGHPKYLEALECLQMCYKKLFQHTADVRDLDRSIAMAREFVNALPQEDPSAIAHAFMLLSESLESLYNQTSGASELCEAIDAAEISAALAPDKSLRARYVFSLGRLFYRKFFIEKTAEDISRAAECFEESTRLEYSLAALDMLAESQKKLWAITHTKADLDRAIDLCECTTKRVAANTREPKWLQVLSLMHCKRYEDGGLLEDIDRSVELMEMAVDVTNDEPMSEKDERRRELASTILKRYDMTKSAEDRDYVINIYRSQVQKYPTHESCGSWLRMLSVLLGMRYEQSHDLKDLEDGIASTRRDVEKLGENPSGMDQMHRAHGTTVLATMLRTRFDRQGDIKDLNESITLLENFASSELYGPKESPKFWTLARNLQERFHITHSKQDLDRAIEISEKAVEVSNVENCEEIAVSMNNLAAIRIDRYEEFGGREDLESAIQEAELAVELMPIDRMAEEGMTCSLPAILLAKYNIYGFQEDIERAIAIVNESRRVLPKEHPLHAALGNNLVQLLIFRFNNKGFTDDLDLAVTAAREAANTEFSTDKTRAVALSHLGIILNRRVLVTTGSGSTDLNGAIEATEQALKLAENGLERVVCLINLANLLNFRFDIREDKNDLHRATQILKDTIRVVSDNFPHRYLLFASLSSSYGRLYEATGDDQYLNDMIDSDRLALSCTSMNTPFWSQVCYGAGLQMYRRYCKLENEEDFDEAVKLFKSGWNNMQGTPSIRTYCAQQAAFSLARKSKWQESYDMFERAIELLPKISPRSLKTQDKQLALGLIGRFGSIACEAVATSLNAGKTPSEALQMLELGRGIITGSLLEMRTDISELRGRHAALADRFLSLRDQLDQPTISDGIAFPSKERPEWISDADQRGGLGRKFDAILDEIRALPDFDNFLLPPKEADIMGAAEKGPIVVVNISDFRCDAFIIEKNRIQVVALPIEGGEIRNMVIQSRNDGITHEILERLWHRVTQPVLDALGFIRTPHHDTWPHMWWIPTGSLSHLPLHAAGKHYKGSSETVLDRVISSYSPSVKALIYAQRIKKSSQTIGKNVDDDNQHGATGNAVVISMKETPGLGIGSNLPFAKKEVDKLKKVFPLLGMRTTEPPRMHDDVLEKMRTCDIFHFAGHGNSDPLDPSKSCLLLDDWNVNPLTVEDLRNSRLQDSPPFLGYLSACSTSANRVKNLEDEGIHLVSAFQLAGFRHVVGTLWEVSDSACVDVAKMFYDTIRRENMTDDSVCRGLHYAVRALRDGDVNELEWEEEVESLVKPASDGKPAVIGHETAAKSQLNNGVAEGTCEANRNDRDITEVYLLDEIPVPKAQMHPRLWAPYIHYGV